MDTGTDTQPQPKQLQTPSTSIEKAEGQAACGSTQSTSSACQDDHHIMENGMMMTTTATKATLYGKSKQEEESLLSPPPPLVPAHKQRYLGATLLITLLSIIGGSTFLVYGIAQAKNAANQSFEVRASELVSLIENTWKDYEKATLSLHYLCNRQSPRNTTRQDFKEFYDYLVEGGLQVEAAQCSPNVTHDERPLYEQRSREFYAQYYPEIDYHGVTGFVPANPNSTTGDADDEYVVVSPSPPRDFYFLVHYVEPVLPNAPAIELDMYSHPPQKREIDEAITTRLPVLSKRLRLVQEKEDLDAYGVIIYHPGLSHSDPTIPEEPPSDLSLVVVRMQRFLKRIASIQQEEGLAVYLYDTSVLNTEGSMPDFLGAGAFHQVNDGTSIAGDVNIIPEIEYDEFVEQQVATTASKLYYERVVPITPSGTWIVSVVPVDDAFTPEISYVLFGGIMIMVAGFSIAAWVNQNAKREAKMNEMRVSSETERARLIVRNAEEAAQNERELNDFLAHEVRNPLSAALSAASFVTSSLNEDPPLSSNGAVISTREDMGVITSSLNYANDLLRNMLDMHKATTCNGDQLQIKLHPVHLLKDIMEPVATMLLHSSANYKLEINCDSDLIINADRIRLKQIILNLASNSCKFVHENSNGFIRIGAHVSKEDAPNNDSDEQQTQQQTQTSFVELFVEDSGPGIPIEKRSHLFEKFQTSLDVMNQGTGVGLSLCKALVGLMCGDIKLDETYDSGIDGCPGARFVVRLPHDGTTLSHLKEDEEFPLFHTRNGNGNHPQQATAATQQKQSQQQQHSSDEQLPSMLRVLFCDDDMVLRKLFVRSIRRVAPTWDIHEAANGETALRMVTSSSSSPKSYDIIFVDQYMSSVERQLLGTETVRALRVQQNFKGIICGLSANDKEIEFLDAGANAFMFKPFPCEEEAVKRVLCRLVSLPQTSPAESGKTAKTATTTAAALSDDNDDQTKQILQPKKHPARAA